MFINRLHGFMEQPEERARAPDCWVVRADSGCYFVTRETALQLMTRLARVWPPQWLRFHDLSGSLIQLRARSVLAIGESSATQRAFDRALVKSLEAEAEAEDDTRPW